jgi:hypothetical protein
MFHSFICPRWVLGRRRSGGPRAQRDLVSAWRRLSRQARASLGRAVRIRPVACAGPGAGHERRTATREPRPRGVLAPEVLDRLARYPVVPAGQPAKADHPRLDVAAKRPLGHTKLARGLARAQHRRRMTRGSHTALSAPIARRPRTNCPHTASTPVARSGTGGLQCAVGASQRPSGRSGTTGRKPRKAHRRHADLLQSCCKVSRRERGNLRFAGMKPPVTSSLQDRRSTS